MLCDKHPGACLCLTRSSRRLIGWWGTVPTLLGQWRGRSIAVNCEIDGLQAVCAAELIEFPHQTPAVWTGAWHNIHTDTLCLSHTDKHTHTHTLTPPCPVSVFELTAALLYSFSYLSNRWGVGLTCSALSSFSFVSPCSVSDAVWLTNCILIWLSHNITGWNDWL